MNVRKRARDIGSHNTPDGIEARVSGVAPYMVPRARRELAQRLGRSVRHVRTATVTLTDINGPLRGGNDKRCVIAVELREPGGLIVVEDSGDDPVSVVERAATRTAAAVGRAVCSWTPVRRRVAA